ncbi:MAG: potassium channel protein [Dehalococcoidales bacterium]|nr:potassium channel protein [Dehalococcoidales bacterium]
MDSHERLHRGLIILASIIATGTIGYMRIEGWPPSDAIYMTMITITTVGYGEVHPLTSAGRIFSIFLILGGVSGALFVLSALVEYIVEGKLGITLRRRQMKAKIAKLKDHFILCGYGRVGEDIAHTFSEEEVSFVVIDSHPNNAALAEKQGYLYLLGDATSDKALLEAGIKKARGLVAAVGSDVDNTYITLSARGLCPNLFIEARASNREAEIKLKRAGANRVVSPNTIGARRMAMLVLRPGVVDFIDTVAYHRGRELQMENIAIGDKSRLVGQTVNAIRRQNKVSILAINREKGRLVANPSGEEVIKAQDCLVIMGTKKQLTTLEGLCEGGNSDE